MSETTPEVTEPAESVDQTGDQETPNEPQTVDALPDWAQREIKKLRDEAANHRQRAKTAADEATSKLSSEFQTERETFESDKEKLLFRVTESERELTKLRAALTAGVKAEQAEQFASRLQGETPEELQEDAQRLLSMFSVSERRSDPSQGASGATALPGNPLQHFVQSRLSR